VSLSVDEIIDAFGCLRIGRRVLRQLYIAEKHEKQRVDILKTGRVSNLVL